MNTGLDKNFAHETSVHLILLFKIILVFIQKMWLVSNCALVIKWQHGLAMDLVQEHGFGGFMPQLDRGFFDVKNLETPV
jgi:hypothetical protein